MPFNPCNSYEPHFVLANATTRAVSFQCKLITLGALLHYVNCKINIPAIRISRQYRGPHGRRRPFSEPRTAVINISGGFEVQEPRYGSRIREVRRIF